MRRVGRKTTPRRGRGFSLVELMIVVVMVGVLATVGIVMFRRWIFHSRSVEAIGMVQSIRVAQERWRAETGGYIDVSTNMTAWYPTTTPGRTLYDWQQVTGNNYAKWQLLNPTVSGPVQFAYVTKSGRPFTAMAVPVTVDKPTWPVIAATIEPWYVIQGMGDTDENGVKSYYVASSLNGELFKEHEGE
ncbi:MAG: prepilin-type N-terminal cleavage/methylation domain-containing protein [Myxococcales bacterium]|nr:prepilin-type N-terminal cleavage/methylation domain-containing protein [Myxococcales bacterium]